MLNRRRVVQGGLATVGSLTVSAPFGARAEGKPPAKVRYSEVVRSMLYAPAYVAITNGYFKDAGLDVSLTTAQGGDKAVAALLSNSADIALIGPESAIYAQNSESPIKTPIFCGLTATDGFMLMSREKIGKFEWSMLKGKDTLGFRPGSTPILFFEAAMRQNGIDPLKDVKLNNNVAIPARVGSWLAGQNQFAIFIEPDASQLELDGKAHFLASIGETVGPADYTTFMATDKYIKENPDGDPGLDRRDLQGATVDRVAIAGAGGYCDRTVLSGRGSQSPGRCGRALSQAQHLEKHAEDRAEGDGEVPGHPGPGQRAGEFQAREVRDSRADRIRQQGEVIRAGTGTHRRRSCQGRASRRGPALLRP